jgi:uncharacterized protein
MYGLFERGVEEFNDQFFFEAHDTWEELWGETTGPHRLFYQGLIQAAVAFYHLSHGNYKGACSQFAKSIAKLEQYLPTYHNVETQPLVERLRECLRNAESLRDGGHVPVDGGTIPRIQFCDNV